MATASYFRSGSQLLKTLTGSASSTVVHQMPDGRAGIHSAGSAGITGQSRNFSTINQWTFAKTASVVILAGGRCYMDVSAGTVTYKRGNHLDYYLGRAVEDNASAATEITVDCGIGEFEFDALDLVRDSFVTTIVGTQALGGLALNQRGSGLNVVISATNEAQKVDALSKGSFANAGNGIVEFAFAVPSDGAGTVVDVSVGLASATHATDASAVTQRLYMHLDANATAINFESADGTTTVAIVDSTTDYVEGGTNIKTVWFDMRNTADVQVYVDGVNVLAASVFNVAAAASEWKLLMHVEKSASTDTYEFDLEYLRVRTMDD